jgi:8-oxo-dGTP pyrophosphatase MutT (NUDIX family)
VRVSLPRHVVERAREFAEGRRTPAEPRDAATVVLMRPGPAGPDLYLLRRQTSMAFAGGMCVFPGGGVDPRDFDSSVAWAGPPPSTWAEQLLTSEEMARALVCAAVRETLE